MLQRITLVLNRTVIELEMKTAPNIGSYKSMVLNPGTRLGAFEITGLLGKGGMGEVYRARDTKLGRDVAIKVLADVVAQDPEYLKRFEKEAKVLASLDHPNVGGIFEFRSAAPDIPRPAGPPPSKGDQDSASQDASVSPSLRGDEADAVVEDDAAGDTTSPPGSLPSSPSLL